MAGVGEAQPAGAAVGHGIKPGGEHGGTGVFQDAAKVAVELAEKIAGVARERLQILRQRADHGGDQRGADAVAGDVADEHAHLGVGDGGDAEEVAADGFGRLVAVDELEGALVRRRFVGKGRVLFGKHRGLTDFYASACGKAHKSEIISFTRFFTWRAIKGRLRGNEQCENILSLYENSVDFFLKTAH